MDSAADLARIPHMPAGVRSVIAALHDTGHDALLVGGAVRDALLGKESCDFDLVSDATPAQVRAACEGLPEVRQIYDLGERFGTIGIAFEDGGTLEVTQFRSDAEGVASTAEKFAADAIHRDFSINAMALDVASGSLLDPLDGRGALAAGLLRCPGAASDRLAEDPLRVLRAARFVSELGFELDSSLAEAMPAAAQALSSVAVERIRDELTKLLLGENADRGLAVLLESGALMVVLPEVAALSGLEQPSFHDLDAFDHTAQALVMTPRRPVMRWAALLHDVGKRSARTVEPHGRIRFFKHAQIGAEIAQHICERLRFSNDDTIAIAHLVAQHMRLGELDVDNPAAVDRAVRKLDCWAGAGDGARLLASAEDVLELTIADFSATAHRSEAPDVSARLAIALAAARERGAKGAQRPPVSGSELMRELGLEEGPGVGRLLGAIENAIEDGRLEPDDREGALGLARDELEES